MYVTFSRWWNGNAGGKKKAIRTPYEFTERNCKGGSIVNEWTQELPFHNIVGFNKSNSLNSYVLSFPVAYPLPYERYVVAICSK